MSEENTLSLPISTLEELRCFICKNYLSCSPVRLLPNGNCICGCCSPLNTDTTIHRVIALEAVLNKMLFPCIFKKFGCPETLLFGKTADHESKCVHKHVTCPINSSTTCSWEGIISQLLDHFKDKHPDFFKDKAEFKLELDKDMEDVLIIENSFAFILKYFYDAKETILKYDVRFCSNKDGFEVFSKIQLINGTDAECNANLKMIECLSYDESFCGLQNAKAININKFLENLNEPDSIVVALKLKVVKPNSNNVTTANDHEVNFDLIEMLKCYKCQSYLIPPIFDLNGKTFCCDCGKSDLNCTSSNNTELLKLVNEAVYPCRWQECNFVGKSIMSKDHEMNCEFRPYSCVYSNCIATPFKLSAAGDHLRTHKKYRTVYKPDKITYKTSFAQSYPRKDILTIKNKRIIGLVHSMHPSPLYTIHGVYLIRAPKDYDHIIGIIHFEHEHCKLESKKFSASSENILKVTLKELPFCFKKTDKLTVTVELFA